MKKKAILSSAIATVAVGSLSFGGIAFAKKGGEPGPPDNPGNKPSVELSNNLSFPAVSETLAPVAPRWNPPESPVLGQHYSYGCDQEQSDGSFNYPNTSCVDDLGNPSVYYTAEECTDDVLPSPCRGYSVERIYWQKVDANDWWADSALGTPRDVAYLDWADNLESNTWNERSVVRVETQPYGSLLVDSGVFYPFDPALESCVDVAEDLGLTPADVCKTGFQMWHVSGQGTTEQWGVRASDVDASEPYIYDSPFQVIHTNNARLNLAKLTSTSSNCPTPTSTGDPSPDDGNYEWDSVNEEWVSKDPTTTPDPCTWDDIDYTAELNVGGKYVYGYNWRVQNVELDSKCGSDWQKTGYWRLTFHTNGSVNFNPDNEVLATTAPPAIPGTAGSLAVVPEAVAVLAEETDTGPLYTPVVDYDNNLTYIDICIEGKTQGGGGGNPNRP